ncbi:MFS transporter [Kordia sp.]|uniref:MFS transporter n=1 Tax=Kordia sp. TaxID=1965332 RepID=UPI0025BED66E|nr:MFS transporter [Kordia sp.]MCH2080926.1 MFS transporter [Saprospiraceae bacterium]
MKNERLLLLILAIVQFTHIIDFMIIMPLGSQFMSIFNITPKQFSLIVSTYAFSAAFFGLISAMFIDRFDRKTALLFNYIGFTIGTLACSFAPDYYTLLAARCITGAFGGVLAALVLAIVGDVIPFERRGMAMGIVMTAFSVASVVGVPVGIYLAALYGWTVPFLAVGIISAIVTVVMFFTLPQMRGHLTNSMERTNPFRNILNIFLNPNQAKALLFSISLMFGHFMIIPFIAPYMQLNVGFTDFEVTYVYAVGGTLTVFLLPLAGKLADRFGHLKIFTWSSILALGSIYAITTLPVVAVWVGICVTSTYFVVSSGRNVPATTLITSVVKTENRGSFMSVRSSINELALALSSFIAGSIITENTDGSLNNFLYVGLLAMLMSVVAIFVGRMLKTVS